jgi:hypothetical protein
MCAWPFSGFTMMRFGEAAPAASCALAVGRVELNAGEVQGEAARLPESAMGERLAPRFSAWLPMPEIYLEKTSPRALELD